MTKIWTVTARGEAVRNIDSNAVALGISEEVDWMYEAPVLIFEAFVKNGFAVPYQGLEPCFEVLESLPDLERNEHRWTVRVAGIHPGYVRVLDNMYRAPGTTEVEIREQDGEILDPHVAYPEMPSIQGFDYQPPDPNGRMRNCHVFLTFAEALSDFDTICSQLETWVCVVWSSGFTPEGMHPGDAGTLPDGVYPFDPNTVAIDYSEIFKVDEACFASLIAYANLLNCKGKTVVELRIENE